MTQADFNALAIGDVIRRKNDVTGYVVTTVGNDHIIAVRVVEATNAAEWDLASKVKERLS
jgi:hypothetical protein